MSDIINLESFLSNKNIIHNETETTMTHSEGLRFFIENKDNADIITYNQIKHISMNEISVLDIDSKGNFFYEYSVERNSDIIDNIRFQSKLNIKLTYNIGGIEYTPEEINKFVLVSAPYHDFKIKITFLEKPNLGDEFKILSRHYIINIQDRKLLQTSNVISQNNIYTNGMCVKKLHFGLKD